MLPLEDRRVTLALGPLAVLLGILVCLLMAGCGMTSAERIAVAQERVEQIEDLSEQLDQPIAQLGPAIKLAEQTAPLLPEAVRTKVEEFLANARPKLAGLTEQKATYDALLAELSAQLSEASEIENPTWADELATLSESAKVMLTVAPAPWREVGLAVLGVVSLIAGGFGAWQKRRTDEARQMADYKSAEASVKGRAVEDLVRGVEVMIREHLPPQHTETLKQVMRVHQTPTTTQLVKGLKPAI
jgi:hypothetical protein